ncbi:MAG: SEC-C metal-binding domain-containing protein [Tepidisphaeraceae bacterium]|jgi:hypothetical protein
MKSGLHRYDPCPCGSGKKYKFCCEGKADPEPVDDYHDEDDDNDDDIVLAPRLPREEPDFDASFARSQAIVGDADLSFKEMIDTLFRHLKANLSLPCEVTGTEDFQWEEPYVIGGWDQREYKRLKRTQPSYRDVFQLLDLERNGDSEWMMFGDDVVAHVRRASDGRDFDLGLTELEATDRKSRNYQLLMDFSIWFVNNR